MQQDNFEKGIQKNLEERELQPSSSAWKTLADRLDNEQKNKYSYKFIWGSIAASIVGILIIFNYLSSSNHSNTLISEPVTVVANEKNHEIKGKDSLFTNNYPKTKDSINTSKSSVHKRGVLVATDYQEVKNVVIKKVSKDEVPNTITTVVTVSQVDEKKEVKREVEKIIPTIQKLDDVIDEVIADAQISNSDVEVDNLLMEAQLELALEKAYAANGSPINADQLLNSVEKDLDISFRNKVLDALRSNFEKLKTAMVMRKNE
ncbi:hypothetical protein [Aquimarina agarivorans]|uniref:hypothetical protein n=1 Tax=Aquimarina agarivorans TaxID=980584 RepID=UPI000248E97B|nr:hypothetical protein [Aquimarina agarivorans]